MSDTLPFYGAARVHRALEYPRLIEALRTAFIRGADSPLRHVHRIDVERGDRLLVMPAWRAGDAIGVKLVTVFPGNAERGVPTVGATYVLLDGATGHPRAVLDGEALTLRRTGAASALASQYLSRPDARVLAVIGAGHLAPYLAAAHCAVRPIERVLVWARRIERARATAATLTAQGLHAEPITSLADAAQAADVITCATTSSEPLLQSGWLRAGVHVDLVGGFTPTMREADDATIARATLFVDTFAGALSEAGDLVQPIARGIIDRDAVVADLAMLTRGVHAGRTRDDEITLFKSVGAALEDLAAAELVVASDAAGGTVRAR